MGDHLNGANAVDAGVTLAGMVPTRRYRVPDVPRVRLHVADLGLACCAVEFVAAVSRGMLEPEVTQHGASADDDPDDQASVNVLVVSGTVTHTLTPAVIEAWEGMPQPRAAIAFGACTISGGPYWDSYAVAPGIDEVIPVAQYVPGCPPRPEALVHALAEVAASVSTAGE